MRPDSLPLGELPPTGILPRNMAAMVIRRDRYGEPLQAMRPEELPVPEVGPGEVLLAVVTAGINYNNVWAARGKPLDVISLHQKEDASLDFHVGGSEAAGIVYRIGAGVDSVQIGDEVVIQGGIWDREHPAVLAGGDPILSGKFRAWGYETNWGSFAQFCVVKDYQCLPRPGNISWEESAVYMLTGATVQRMLFHWEPNRLQRDDPVLIWGASGGLGVMAIQLARRAGGLPIAVVNSEAKREICLQLGAIGVIDRTGYDHWGEIPADDIHTDAYLHWKKGARSFREAVLEFTDGKDPAVVLEHPGSATFPTSLYTCAPGGMVVTCGATSGYGGTFDLRYLWIFQKRIQGSHFASLDECRAVNDLISRGEIRPVLSKVYTFEEIPIAHQLMAENRHPCGNMAIRIGCV